MRKLRLKEEISLAQITQLICSSFSSNYYYIWSSKPGSLILGVEVGTESRGREPHLSKNAACFGIGYYFHIFTAHTTHGEEHCATATCTMRYI